MATNQSELGPTLGLDMRAALGAWEHGPGPAGERLAAALAGAIADGRLVAGTLLPPERRLCAQLGVGRAVVAAAYGRLERDRLVERRQGRGTQVTGPVAHRLDARAAQRATALQANVGLHGLGTRHLHAIDLRSGSGAPSPAVVGAMERALSGVPLRRLAGSAGYHPRGLPLLRERVAAHLTALGLPTDDPEVLITTGAQQALTLVAACYVPPGGTVVVEDPGFNGIVDAFRSAGARVLGVRVGPDGVDSASLEATLARNAVSAVVLTPTFQTPTGATVPGEVRRELVALARRTGALLVDDGTAAELSLGAEPPPPLAHTAPAGSVLSIGSLSKLVWAGLRVGWIRAPRVMIDQIAAIKGASDLGSSVIGQAVAAELLADAAPLREIRRRELRARLQVLGDALRSELPEWEWRPPGGGVSLWVRLPAGGATDLAHRAEGAGLLVTPGPAASPTRSFDDHLVLPFDHEPDVLRAAVERLAALWRADGA